MTLEMPIKMRFKEKPKFYYEYLKPKENDTFRPRISQITIADDEFETKDIPNGTKLIKITRDDEYDPWTIEFLGDSVTLPNGVYQNQLARYNQYLEEYNKEVEQWEKEKKEWEAKVEQEEIKEYKRLKEKYGDKI